MKILTEKVLASESVEGRPFKKIAKTLRGVVIVTDGSSKMKPKLSLKRASVEAFLIRLTKGFIFKFYPGLHNPENKFLVEYLTDPNERNPMVQHVVERLSGMEFRNIGDGVFRFWHGSEDGLSLWIFSFYEGPAFSVIQSPEWPSGGV